MRKTILALLNILLMAAACSRNDDVSNYTELYDEIKSVDKMVFASMAITKTAKSERNDWYKIGKRIAVYSYDSYLRAYIDLSALQLDDLVFDKEAKTVKVTLPPITTEVTGRDIHMRKEYENIGLLRSDLDSKERAQIKETANASFRKEIEENPLFKRRLTEEAQRNARKYFETLLEANGYTASIEFKH